MGFIRVVGDLCCVQAQILSAAEWAVGLRLNGATRVDIERALWADRLAVKIYGPRRTLHLVSAESYQLWIAALRTAYGVSERPDSLSLAIADSLDGAVLSRKELAAAVKRRLGSAAPPGLTSTWGDHLSGPAYRGFLCFAESVGSEVRFARPDQWFGPSQPVEGETALREVCLRYVRTFGPTTPKDFARWLLIPTDRAKAIFAELGTALVEVTIGRKAAYIEAGDHTDDPEIDEPAVRLVPQYDPYILNSQPRGDIVAKGARALIKTYGQGRNEGAVGVPVLLVDGHVAGIWRYERERLKQAATVVVDCFCAEGAALEAAIRAEAERLGAFHGIAVQLRLEPLAARA